VLYGASAGSGGFLPARLLVSDCFHSGVSYGHFAISMHQAGGPHPYQGRVRPDLSGEAEQPLNGNPRRNLATLTSR
jgi:hypothetical protein